MDLQRRYGITLGTLRQMYEEWASHGVPKSVVEARYLRTRRFHGKLFSRLVLKYLGIETQAEHPLLGRVRELEEENSRLRQLLRAYGLTSDEADEEQGRPGE